SDEIFANFREINTTGMKKGILFRGSNPFNPAKNKNRYSFVSALLAKHNIRTVVNLADTDSKLKTAFATAGYDAAYAKRLYDNGNVIALGMAADFFKQDSLDKIAQGIRFMLAHEGPYFFHCNEGKDRAGAFAAILEAVAGASAQEIKDDYMITYMNYYHLSKGDNKYKELEKITIDHLLYLICNPEMVKKLNSIDWSKTDSTGMDVNAGVKGYLLNCVKITEAEYNQLKKILTGNPTAK
ncbi:MAG TPA: hypothetical protein DCO86_01700, partial [Spirochaetaceae bacterium]|nr:hypothetical protein [Spirochaetaceae bacterium]